MMKEFNNRKTAKQHAEYITGKALRLYMAEKVKKYVGDNPSVFDGAIGSGQLEQFINPSMVYGVEIQEKACEVCRENYPMADIQNMSFFDYQSDVVADVVVMNPPFSLKFNDLSEKEKANIQTLYPWKKSGVVDDIFILKSLQHCKRYAFHICFPGVGYRKSEKQMRDIIGNQLAECNFIDNAFEDTSIPVLFLVIDKEKTTEEVYKELYDCKQEKVLHSLTCTDVDDRWRQVVAPKEEKVIDIEATAAELSELSLQNFEKGLQMELTLLEIFYEDFRVKLFIEGLARIKEILANAEREFERIQKTGGIL